MIASNPVLLKELRQSVRNRYVLAAYLLFLAGLLVVIGLMVAAWMRDSVRGREDSSFGLTLFHTVYGIVTTVAVLFIPTYVAIRLLRERWGSNLDLQFCTTIRPSALAWGKVWSGLAVAGLLMSGAVPFMAFSHLLRGIDLPSIFLCVVLALGVLVVLILSAVLFAAFPASKLVRALVGLLAAGMLIPVCTMLNTGAFGIVSSGVAASLGSTETLRVIAIGFCLWLSVVLGLHAFAVAALSPPSADRMRLVRITATALWVLWGVGLAIATSVTSDSDYAESWVAASLLALAGFAIQATSERPALGRRILARTPDGTLRRLAAFPFATGQVQALTWVLLLLGATLLVGRSVDQSSPAGMGALDAMKAFSTMVVAYALSVTLLWRLLLRRLMSSEHLWGVTVLAILAGGIVPTLVEIFASDGADGWLFGNIFEAGNADALPLALGWCALATALFSPFVVRAFTVFRPPQEPIVPR